VSGQLDLALVEAEAALEAATTRDAPLDRADALLHHAAVSMQLGRIDDALRNAGDGLALREEELGPTHPTTIRARQNLASTLHAANEPQKARDVLAVAVDGARRELGEESSLFATLLASLVIIDGQLGAHDATVTEGARAIALAERLGQSADENLIYVRVAMAHSFAALGRHDESERTISEAVALQERLLGPDHPQLALVLIARGENLRERGKCEPALVDFQRALRLAPERSRDAAYASMGIGLCRLSADDHEGARRSLERALVLHRELGNDPKDIAATERALATATSD
jgi:eukaryotic-like serine/threonine-protein kinase